MSRMIPLADRFWAKVRKSTECWEWTAAVNKDGYGQIGRGGGEPGNMVGAHRVSYELHFGPIPTGMKIDHTCHSPGCVNPGHLRAATHKQNMENRASAQANNKSTGIRGVYRVSGSDKFQVVVGHRGKRNYGGIFATKQEASAAAVALRNQLFTHNDRDRIAAP